MIQHTRCRTTRGSERSPFSVTTRLHLPVLGSTLRFGTHDTRVAYAATPARLCCSTATGFLPSATVPNDCTGFRCFNMLTAN